MARPIRQKGGVFVGRFEQAADKVLNHVQQLQAKALNLMHKVTNFGGVTKSPLAVPAWIAANAKRLIQVGHPSNLKYLERSIEKPNYTPKSDTR